MTGRSDRLFNTLAVVAVTVAAMALVVRVFPQLIGQQTHTPVKREPVPIADWEKYAAFGHRIGPVNAAVTILEFADFECPACKQFTTKSLSAIRAKYPDDVAIVFRHWPLAMHKFAYPAARAAECAADQGRFVQMHDLLYAKQDSFGLKPFIEYAKESGVKDLHAFATCDSARGEVPVIARDSAAAKAIGGTGTPTVVINGIRYPGGLSSQMLDSLVQLALKPRK